MKWSREIATRDFIEGMMIGWASAALAVGLVVFIAALK
jgi:hypothetical protein